MSPRKRRAIASMLLAGVKSENITGESIKNFIENQSLPNTNVPDVEIINTNESVEKITEEIEIFVTPAKKKKKKKKAKKESKPALKVLFSMKNTKAQLLEAANDLNIDVKSSMNKQSILDLINANN